MKIRKKIVSFILVAMLICVMAMPASAKSFSTSGLYNGSTWEISDTCNLYSYTSTTYYEDQSCTVRSDVQEYSMVWRENNGVQEYQEILMHITPGSGAVISSTTQGYTAYELSRIFCKHYVNSANVYSSNVNAS